MTRPDAPVIICAISRKAAILYHIVKENCIQIPSQLDICMVPSSCLFLLYIVGWLQCWVHKYPGWLLVLVSSEECPHAECCMWPVRNHAEKSFSLLASRRPHTVKSIYFYNKVQTDIWWESSWITTVCQESVLTVLWCRSYILDLYFESTWFECQPHSWF